MNKPLTRRLITALGFAGALAASAPALAQVPQVDMVVFGPPSLGAFLTPVIKTRKIDEKNGININFVERTPDAYIAQFNSGQFPVGGSAALLSVAVASNKGVKISYLFNVFDFFGAVVTDNPEIKTLKDLEGRQLVAASATTNFAIFKWLALTQGVDVAKIKVQNTATPGLVGYALADRAEAVQLWEPGYSILMAKKPAMRTLDMNIAGTWKKYAGSPNIPYLGVAAHDEWIKANPLLVDKLYATFKEAGAWVLANPAASAKLIAASIKGSDEAVIRGLIENNDRLGLNVQTAGDMKKGIEAMYAAGRQSGYLDKDVSPTTIYGGIRK